MSLPLSVCAVKRKYHAVPDARPVTVAERSPVSVNAPTACEPATVVKSASVDHSIATSALVAPGPRSSSEPVTVTPSPVGMTESTERIAPLDPMVQISIRATSYARDVIISRLSTSPIHVQSMDLLWCEKFPMPIS